MRLALRRTLLMCLVLLWPIGPGSADDGVRKQVTPWPDRFVSRLTALALLQTLNADLLSHDSATLTLERWCDTHHMASPARIVAERVKGADKQPTAEQLQLLGVSTSDAVGYREYGPAAQLQISGKGGHLQGRSVEAHSEIHPWCSAETFHVAERLRE